MTLKPPSHRRISASVNTFPEVPTPCPARKVARPTPSSAAMPDLRMRFHPSADISPVVKNKENTGSQTRIL